jgi:hypothetical protein
MTPRDQAPSVTRDASASIPAATVARARLAEIAPHVDRGLTTDRATWHRTDDGAVRVVLTRWGRHDAVAQRGVTCDTLRHAWRVAVAAGCVHRDKASDRCAFLAWCTLGRA